MKKTLLTIGAVFLVSLSGGFAILLAHGAGPSEALRWMATAGYSIDSFEMARPLAVVCVGAGFVAAICIWAGLLCLAVYGLTRVVKHAWTGKEAARS